MFLIMSLRGPKRSSETISTIKTKTIGAEILGEIASFFAMTKHINLMQFKIKTIDFNPPQKAVLAFSAYQRNYYPIQKVKTACH